jgi:hypothetical protein
MLQITIELVPSGFAPMRRTISLKRPDAHDLQKELTRFCSE